MAFAPSSSSEGTSITDLPVFSRFFADQPELQKFSVGLGVGAVEGEGLYVLGFVDVDADVKISVDVAGHVSSLGFLPVFSETVVAEHRGYAVGRLSEYGVCAEFVF